jgi:hypothetical protein
MRRGVKYNTINEICKVRATQSSIDEGKRWAWASMVIFAGLLLAPFEENIYSLVVRLLAFLIAVGSILFVTCAKPPRTSLNQIQMKLLGVPEGIVEVDNFSAVTDIRCD